jgi:hypothetical protein
MNLYKYLSPRRVDVLRDLKIRFTQPSALNDPFEMQPVVTDFADDPYITQLVESRFDQLVAEQYQKSPISQHIPFDVFRKLALSQKTNVIKGTRAIAKVVLPLMKKKIADLDKQVGILSLTESPDNLLMWAHYADNHRGMIVEFDGNDAFFNRKRTDGDEFYHLRKVVYASARPRGNLVEMGIQEFLLTKSSDWAYEQEWRILAPLTEATRVVPHSEFDVHLFPLPPACVKSVIFGARMSDNDKSTIIGALKSTTLKRVLAKQAVLDDVRFAVRIIDVPESMGEIKATESGSPAQ